MKYLKLVPRVLYLFTHFWRMTDAELKAEINRQRALIGREPIP